MNKMIVKSLCAVFLVSGICASSLQAAPVKMRFAHPHTVTDPLHISALEFSKRVKERTNGDIDIKVFPNSQLGNDNTVIGGVRGGTIDISCTGNPFFTGIIPKLNVLDLPYQFDDGEQVARILDGAFGRSLLDEFDSRQMKGLAFWENGFRSLANSRHPVKNAADIKGLKLRTTPNPAHILAFQLLGASPQPMPFAEVFSALEARAIDGHENPPTLMFSSKMYEVQKYLSLTKHAYTALIVVMNKTRFDSLKPEYQKILLEEALNAARLQRKLNAEGQVVALKEMRRLGMEIIEDPDVESIKAVVRDATRKVFIEKNGEELLKQIDALR